MRTNTLKLECGGDYTNMADDALWAILVANLVLFGYLQILRPWGGNVG